MSILKWAAPRIWNRVSRINPMFEVKIGEKNLRVPSNALQWTPCWRTDLIEHFVKLNKGDFIDIGANVGQTLYDYYSVEHEGRYIGFEPNSHCISVLEDIIQRNDLAHYSLVPIGLSDSNTILSLYINAAKDPGATLIANLRPERGCVSKLVPVFRFDEIRETLGISQIVMMKIDVEGAERQVIAGMQETLARFKPPIVCEVLRVDLHADKENYKDAVYSLMEMLTRADYSVFRIEKTGDGANARLGRVTRVAEFPLDAWTPEKAEENDYLFIPVEKENLLPGAA